MELELSSLGRQPTTGSVPELLICRTSPAVLSVGLDEHERLDEASLVIHRAQSSGLATPSVILATSAGGSTRGVRWLEAGWGDVRRLRGFSLALDRAGPIPRLVVGVDRGDARWRSPVEPPMITAVASRGGRRVHVKLRGADVDAVRLRVELYRAGGSPAAVDLDPDAPLEVELEDDPRDLYLTLRDHRSLLRWRGSIPAGEGLVVDDLAARVAAVVGPRGPASLVLELGAEVAGDIALGWSFVARRSRAAAKSSSLAAARARLTPTWGAAAESSGPARSPGP